MNVTSGFPQKSASTCSQCGGTAREVSGTRYLQCNYCQSLIFPHGSPLETDSITPLGEALDSVCPCCCEPLQKGKIDGHHALYCQSCYGILIRNSTFGTVVRNRRSARGRLESQELRAVNPDEFRRSLLCPSCQKRMETHPYYGPGNVVIDSCCDCSVVWLDHGELAALARSDGQLERQPAAPEYMPAVSPRSLPVTTALTNHEPSPLEALFDLLF